MPVEVLIFLAVVDRKPHFVDLLCVLRHLLFGQVEKVVHFVAGFAEDSHFERRLLQAILHFSVYVLDIAHDLAVGEQLAAAVCNRNAKLGKYIFGILACSGGGLLGLRRRLDRLGQLGQGRGRFAGRDPDNVHGAEESGGFLIRHAGFVHNVVDCLAPFDRRFGSGCVGGGDGGDSCHDCHGGIFCGSHHDAGGGAGASQLCFQAYQRHLLPQEGFFRIDRCARQRAFTGNDRIPSRLGNIHLVFLKTELAI